MNIEEETFMLRTKFARFIKTGLVIVGGSKVK